MKFGIGVGEGLFGSALILSRWERKNFKNNRCGDLAAGPEHMDLIAKLLGCKVQQHCGISCMMGSTPYITL